MHVKGRKPLRRMVPVHALLRRLRSTAFAALASSLVLAGATLGQASATGAGGRGSNECPATGASAIVAVEPVPGEVGGPAVAPFVDAGTGHVFIAGSQGGTVEMRDGCDGSLLRTLTMDAPIYGGALDQQRHLLLLPAAFDYNQAHPRTLYVLDTRTGTLLRVARDRRTTDCGASGGPVLLDPYTGHVFLFSDCEPGGPITITLFDEASGLLRQVAKLDGLWGGAAIDPRHSRLVVQVDRTLYFMKTTDGSVALPRVVLDPLGVVSGITSDEALGQTFIARYDRIEVYDDPTAMVRYVLPRAPDGNDDGRALLVDRHSGRLLVLCQGQAAVDFGLDLCTYDGRTGKVLKQAVLPERMYLQAVDTRHGLVLATTQASGMAYLLDEQSGAVVRRFAVDKLRMTGNQYGQTVPEGDSYIATVDEDRQRACLIEYRSSTYPQSRDAVVILNILDLARPTAKP